VRHCTLHWGSSPAVSFEPSWGALPWVHLLQWAFVYLPVLAKQVGWLYQPAGRHHALWGTFGFHSLRLPHSSSAAHVEALRLQALQPLSLCGYL